MDEIGLEELIYQVKRELLAPNPQQRAADPDPLFFVEKVELEIAIKVQREGSGNIKLSVLSFADLRAGGSILQERGHVVKVSLAPLLPKEEILTELLREPAVLKRIQTKQEQAFSKGDTTLAGTPE